MQNVSIQAEERKSETSKEILQSPLFASGGYMVLPGWISEDTLNGLLSEARACRPNGVRCSVANSDGTEGRGGSPARAFRSGPGGGLHRRLYGSPQIAEALGRFCSARVAPTGGGTYSYYEQAGDSLALHRDVVNCDIAVITCLALTGSHPSAGGLLVYPRHIGEPLSKVRAAGRLSGIPLPLGRGDTAVLLGGILPHEVTPLSMGQERIVAINCYRVF
jgi:hypothetical protein